MDNKPEDLQPGDLIIEAGGDRTPYELVADEEPLKAHISKVASGKGQNWTTKEPEDRLVVSYHLDEPGEGQGQVYNAWYKPSIYEKSKLYPVIVAALGTVDSPFDPTALLGMPVRIMLENKEKDGEVRQYVKTVLKPGKDQKKVDVTADVVLEDIEEVNYDDVFDEAGNVKK